MSIEKLRLHAVPVASVLAVPFYGFSLYLIGITSLRNAHGYSLSSG